MQSARNDLRTHCGDELDTDDEEEEAKGDDYETIAYKKQLSKTRAVYHKLQEPAKQVVSHMINDEPWRWTSNGAFKTNDAGKRVAALMKEIDAARRAVLLHPALKPFIPEWEAEQDELSKECAKQRFSEYDTKSRKENLRVSHTSMGNWSPRTSPSGSGLPAWRCASSFCAASPVATQSSCAW